MAIEFESAKVVSEFKERFFRTLKYNNIYVSDYQAIKELHVFYFITRNRIKIGSTNIILKDLIHQLIIKNQLMYI